MNNFDFPAIFCASALFVCIMGFGVAIIIDDIKDNKKLKGCINEKNLQALNKYVKKSKEIDQEQADRMSSLLEETLTLLRQKKITRE